MKGVVVFTGTLSTQTRDEAARDAEAHGYSVGKSMTKATTLLVCGGKVGAKKIADAEKLNVKVLTEEEWTTLLTSDGTGNADAGEDGSDEEEDEAMAEDEDEEEQKPAKKKAAPAKRSRKVAEKEEEGGDDSPGVVAFTGTLKNQTRAQAVKQAEAHGYTVSSTVSNATTVVVYGEKAGEKLEDAKRKKKTVYSEMEWEAKLGVKGLVREPAPKKPKVEAGPGDKGVVVFTGTLTTQTRKQASDEAEKHGYVVSNTMTKATTILVCGDKVGQKKMDDAKKLGVQVLTEEEWSAKLGGGAAAEEDGADEEEADEGGDDDEMEVEEEEEEELEEKAAVAGKDECVVFTGTLLQQTRKVATAQAEACGYSVGNSVTKQTTILVCGENAGKKVMDAKKKGIVVYTEDEWAKRLASERGGRKEKAVATTAKKVDESSSTAKPNTSEERGVVVFTGKLLKQTRQQATAAAKAKGFVVAPKMTKDTKFLVCGERTGQKLADAEKLNATILTEDEWDAKLVSIDDEATSNDANEEMDVVDDDDAEPSYDEETGAINGVSPDTLIPDGTFHEVKSASSSSSYTVKRLGSVYSCNCMAWRNQRSAPTSRTCKHLKQILGEKFETVRVGAAGMAPPSRSSAKAAAAIKASAPNVLLAKKWEREKQDPVGWWISEKLDGVRAYWDSKKKVFYSRLGNLYPAPEWFTADFPKDVDFDGELFGGRSRFQFTVGIAKTSGSKHWDQLVYKVFDAPSLNGKGFEERMQHAKEKIEASKCKFIEWVEHTKCTSLQQLDTVFDEIEKLGGEGLMIREPKSKYFNGRSSSLLKIKSFHDGEALVIAHEDGKGKYVGMVGALRCKMASGKMFKVASGLSDEQREHPPAVGTIIVYKCQELTNDGIPRFPVFLGIAADKTCAKDPIIANAVDREEE